MPSTPYMKLYIGDYLGDTSHLSALQHGAYLLLIMAYWQRGGPLRNTDVLLSNIARTTPVEWAECRETILEFFEERDGYLYHKRIERELHKRAEISEKCKEAVGKRWNERNTDVLPTNNECNTTPIVHRSIDPEEENTEDREAPDGARFEVVEVIEPTSSPLSSLPEEAPALASLLFTLHRDQIDSGYKVSPAQLEAWARDIDKLNRLDGRPWPDIEAAVRWIKTPGQFWAPNIMSGATLRKKFPTIVGQMKRPAGRVAAQGSMLEMGA